MTTTRYRSLWLCLSWLVIAGLLLPPNLAVAITLTPVPAAQAETPTPAPAVETQDIASLPSQPVTLTDTDTVTATDAVAVTPLQSPLPTPALTPTVAITLTPALTVTPTLTDTTPLTVTDAVTVTPVVTETADTAGVAATTGDGSSDIYDGWQLTYNAPNVALFRGAATYNYPFALPAARGRFQPTLNLSYNSTRVDGILSLVDSEWVGLGWSIDMVDIVRTDVKYAFPPTNTQWLSADNNFTLLLNGAGYELIAAETTVDHGRYYAEGAPDIYVERINDCSDGACGGAIPPAGGSPNNITGEYWVVRTGDGTTYQLGYTQNSEQLLYRVYNTNNSGAKYIGRAGEHAVYRWRVDHITDVFGNVTEVTYNEAHTSNAPVGGLTYRDTASLLSSIRYNSYGSGQWLTEIKFITNSVQFPAQPSWSSAPIFGKQNRLDRLEIWQNGMRQSYYQFTYNERPPLTEYPYEGLIRELRAIQPRSDGGAGLPATTFAYQDFRNKTVCIIGCSSYHEQVAYNYPRLTQVANGYGARTEFSYADDGRANPTDQFFNYRVTEMRTFDGVQAIVKSPAKVAYEYGARCYDQNDGGPGATNYGSLCRGRSTLNPIGPLAGHATVTARMYGYDGALLTRAVHAYYTDDSGAATAWRRALEYQSQVYTGTNTLKQQSDTTWGHTDQGASWFTHADRIDTTRYQGGATTTSAVQYSYDAYNHVSAEYQHGDTAAGRTDDDRTIHRQYSVNANTNIWIVNTVSRERVYRGIVTSDAGGANLKTETLNYYDGNGSITMSPSQGRLTQVSRGGAGGVWVNTVYGYDTWGNLTQTTDPKGNTTTATYETTYHQFPVQTCPPLPGLCTTTNYYGVNEETTISGDFGLFGQVQRSYASYNVATRTIFSYDVFGRLLMEVRPGDNFVPPTTRYVYHDPLGALPTILNAGFENRVSSTTWPESDTSNNVQTYAQDATQAYAGTKSLRISVTGSDEHYIYQDLSGGQAERTYQIYAYVKATTNGQQLCLSASGMVGHETPRDCRTATGTWELLISSVTLPVGANRFRLILSTPNLGTLYVDEVGVKELFAASVYAKEGTASNTLWNRQVYDGLGRVIQTQAEFNDAVASVVDQRYDAVGNVIMQSVPYTRASSVDAPWYVSPALGAAKTTTQYDPLGRPVQVTAPDGAISRFDYYGRQTAVLDAKDHLKISAVDDFGQLIVVREYNGEYTQPLDWVGLANASNYYARTRYTYDVLGNLTIVTDTLNNVTTMTYDNLGRKIGMVDPDMGAWSYVYDANSNLTRQTDARGKRSCFYYDALNRLTGKHYRNDNACPTSNPALNVAYTYDAGTYGKGQRTGMTDASGSAAWTYDMRGQVTQTLQTIGDETFKTQWEYDPMGRVKWMKYPADSDGNVNEQVNTTYNAAGQVNSVASAFSYVSSSAYDIAGRLTQRNYGNTAFYATYGYYDWTWSTGQGRLKTLRTGAGAPPNNTSLQNMTYTYDKVGNVLSIVDAKAGPQTQRFGYDPLNRLITATVTGGTDGIYSPKTFSYNAIGNLTNNGDGVLTYPASGPGVARPHAVTAWANDTYGYDANGNMTSRFDGASTLSYDAENRLTTVSGATSASFTYDGDGNRVKSVMGNVTTYYVGNYFEWTDSTSTMVKYYYAGGQRVAMKKGSVITWLFGDHLGSTAKTYVNGAGAATEQRYYPWGGTRYGSSPTAFQYTGQRNDSSIGLYFYNARYYDPYLNRFLSPDTIIPDLKNPQSLNRYSYTYNNPLRYIDDSGHIPVPPIIVGLVVLWMLTHPEPALTPGDYQDTLTIYAVQPVKGSEIPLNPDNIMDVGHSFVQIVDGQTGETHTRGFYPDGAPKSSPTAIEFPGSIRDDQKMIDNKRTTEGSFPISDAGYEAAHKMMYTDPAPEYNLHTYNCTDWALDVAEVAGIAYAPTGKRWWHPWIATPATLGAQLYDPPEPVPGSRPIEALAE